MGVLSGFREHHMKESRLFFAAFQEQVDFVPKLVENSTQFWDHIVCEICYEIIEI